jgi:peptidoglycan/LPS O-acetylase OafA/YrhL
MPHRPRYPWIDLLKAAGIVAVIWIHAFNRFDVAQTPLVERLSMLSRFAVPAFFLASGFLQAVGRRTGPGEFFTQRLRRLLVPYGVASAVAILFRWLALGESFAPATMLRMLVTGDAWGIYYFLPLLVVTSALGEILFRFPRLAWPVWIGLTVLGILAYQLQFYAGSFAAELRNPLRWWGWFCGGWLLAVERGRIDAWGGRVRMTFGGLLVAAAGGCFVAAVTWLPPGWSRTGATLEYLMVEGLLLGTALAAWQGRCPAAIRWLSEASYPLYLQHYFFIVILVELAGWGRRPMVVFLVTLVATIGSVLVLTKISGPWARLLFGAPAAVGASRQEAAGREG